MLYPEKPEKDRRFYLKLAEIEKFIGDIASRIFCVYLNNDSFSSEQEDMLIERAVRQAIKLAKKSDELIKADSEI